MNNLLTDRDFWVKYWESKTDYVILCTIMVRKILNYVSSKQ